jgi:chorismate-pyruvate lyase
MNNGSEAADSAITGQLQTSCAANLFERLYVAQQARPADWSDLDPVRIDPFIRLLMITDGTLHSLLEAAWLEPTDALVREQNKTTLSRLQSQWLDAGTGVPALIRCVEIRGRSSRSLRVRAESIILPERLPPSFVAALGSMRAGIGQTLASLEVERRRDLLWFGAWDAGGALPTRVPSRSYRVVMRSHPVMMITESMVAPPPAWVCHLPVTPDFDTCAPAP